jgi:NADP-dependent 3-hydroxy acid dehydrogenase YdfG
VSVVAITGASAGVGRATARAFARRGDAVALIARSEEGLQAAAREVHAAGGRALVCPLDVTDAEALQAAAREIERTLGPVDVWVNCAMAAVLAPVAETSAADVRRVTDVTYLGYVHGTLAVLPAMRARDRGVIVMVGSALAYRAIPLQATYCAAKHAVRGFTDALRCELMAEHSGVRVTTVHLPGLNTPQFGWVKTTLRRHPQPVPPIYQPEVAADAIVWASEHPRREYFVGGSTVLTVAGNKLAPRVADRYLARTNIEAQQTGDRIPPGRPDYLYAPLPGLHATHGRFDAVAKDRSPTWWATKHRARLAAGALLAGAAGLGAAAARRR